MEWLQLVYRVPAEPTRGRTAVWRHLRGLGAVYLQAGCCVLPRTPESERGFAEAAAKVREHRGDAALSVLGPAEAGWEERLVGAVNRARDEEYEEVADTAERLVEEIARERRKGKVTFAVLEEVEDGHERLERWLARVCGRDLCGAAGRAAAEAKVVEAGRAVAAFVEEVHGRDAQGHQGEKEGSDRP